MLRKVITIQDLTLCLDKMDASGKIEIYQVISCVNYVPHTCLGIRNCSSIKKGTNLNILINVGSRFISMFNDHSHDHKLSQQYFKKSIHHTTRSSLRKDGIQYD